MSIRVAMNLLWCRPGVGGSEEYLTRQLAGIAANGHPVEIEVFAPRGFVQRLPAVAGAFRVHEAPSDCERRPGRVLLEHTWLAARTSDFDIVHHGEEPSPSAATAARSSPCTMSSGWTTRTTCGA